jgi:UDP-galactopyranose mutase
MKYDYLIVGSGLFGSTFAQLAKEDGKKCLIIDKRDHIGGNCYTKNVSGIDVHMYGPHVFHTNNDNIWNYVNKFTKFSNYINRPKVNFNDKIYSFPINLMTLYQLWNIKTPEEARTKLDNVKIKIEDPKNLEEWILSQVGEEIYYTFIYGYTKKQWNTEPRNLPSFIIKRLPIRLNFDDNYFFDKYQGIPEYGYTKMISNMIDGIDLDLHCDYLEKKDYYDSLAKRVLYTGPIDKFFDYSHGTLSYRSLRFEISEYQIEDYQGNAIINYTSESIPYTRTIEHKHFTTHNSTNTIVSKEYPQNWKPGLDEYYPINNELNNTIYNNYKKLSSLNNKYIFGGRLAEYKYYDMHQIIGSAMNIYNKA